MAPEAKLVKKKKYSKHIKRNWRKHTDIKAVEKYLDEVRRDERTGGPAKDKANDSLFFVDTVKLKIPEKDELLPKRSKRKRKILKQDELLLPDAWIKPISSKKRKTQKTKKKTEVLDDGESSDEELQKDSNRNQARKKETVKKEGKTTYFDLWSTNDNPVGEEYYLKVTRKTKIKAPITAKRKVTELPAVEVCAPGASYNPTFEEHQDLLKNANAVEVEKMKKIEKLDRQVKWISKEEAANLPTWVEEMSQGLFDDENDESDSDANDDNDDDDDDDDLQPIKSTQRKTKQQKRKQNEERKKQREQEAEKELKLKENDIFRIKSLRKEMDEKEKEIKEKIQKKKEGMKDEFKKTKRLGRQSFEEAAIEIKLSDEITGNLRSMKPEGNLLEDRFKSLQKRNIIEPRQRVKPHRRYALKQYVKRSYKQPCIKEYADGSFQEQGKN